MVHLSKCAKHFKMENHPDLEKAREEIQTKIMNDIKKQQ